MRKFPYYRGKPQIVSTFDFEPLHNAGVYQYSERTFREHRETRDIPMTDLSLRTSFDYATAYILQGLPKGARKL